MVDNLMRLFVSLSQRRRLQLVLLLILMLLSAIAEVVTLGAIIPFLAVLADPDQALQRPIVVQAVASFGLSASVDIRLQLTVFFAIAAIISGSVRLALVYCTAKVNYGIGHELGAEVYRRSLYQPYEVHVARNSSEIIGGIQKVDIVVFAIFHLLNSVSALVISTFIVAALLWIDSQIALIALGGFGGVYVLVSLITRKQLHKNSEVINQASNARLQALQEGLGGIRDVLLDHTQSIFANRFNSIDWPLRQAQASNNFIGPSPRFVVEPLGMLLVALLGYQMTTSGGGITAVLPTLGALVLGAQRLMPLLQQAYQGWSYFAGNRAALADVTDLLHQPVALETQAEVRLLQFRQSLKLDGVRFSYQSHLPPAISQLDLVIDKGARIGFVGATGGGKSTAIDLIMGLLQPSTGQVVIDGVPLTHESRLAWQRNIAHVPQTIFLADASFAENIAFGVPVEKIDMERVRDAAKKSRIADYIEAHVDGYSSMVGERGVRLSGGQRQRIGIARALYKRAPVLVLDEATSALDSETESAVMDSISQLGRDLTIIMVAHRLSTLKDCDLVYEIMGGVIQSVRRPEKLINSTVLERGT